MLQFRECSIQELDSDVRLKVQQLVSESLDSILAVSQRYNSDRGGDVSDVTGGILATLGISQRYLSNSERGYKVSTSDKVNLSEKSFFFGDRKEYADRFASSIKRAIAETNGVRSRMLSKSDSSSDIADQLVKLTELKKNNLITEEEFVAAK